MCLSICSFGQSIVKSSIDSGGASASAGNIQVLYTIGEVAVQESSAGNIIISEGFIDGKLGITLSTEQVNVFNTLKIYPNPTSSVIHIDNIGDAKLQKVGLYDATGKMLVTEVIGATNTKQDLSLEHLPNGIYFLRLENETGYVTKKVIKK